MVSQANNFENVQSPILENIFMKLSETDSEFFSSFNAKSFDTKYLQRSEFFQNNNSVNDFSILNVNIRSMQKNFETFKTFFKSLNFLFDVICLTETWEDPDSPINNNSLFNLPCYDLISQPRTQKKGGGTAIYILSTLSFQFKKQQSFLTKNIECLTIEVSNENGKNICVSCVYRPPDGSILSFIKSIKKTLFNATKENKNIFLAGDVNIDALTYNKFKNTKTFYDDLLEKNIFPSIHKPTRVTRNSYSIIDNIFSNNLSNGDFEAGIFKTDISDHFPTFLIVRNICNIKKSSTSAKVFKRNLTKTNLDSLKNAYNDTSWNDVLSSTSTNTSFSYFSKKIQNIFDKVCPLSEVKVKPKELQNSWMTNGLKKSSKRKQKLYNKFLKSRSIVDENNYKNYKNLFQKLLKKSKSNYYSNQLNKHKSDSKKTWQIINEITGRKKPSNDTFPKSIKHGGTIFHDKHKICTEFNKYFVSVGPNLASKIPHVNTNYKDFLGNPHDSELLDKDLTYKEFDKSVSALKANKAAGFDDLNSNVILHVISSIRKPLFHVLHLSIKEGVFPEILKTSKVNPIYKKGDPSLISNYRPISLIPIFSKIFERVIYNRIYNHMISNNLFYKKQFGFQKNCSTEHAIIELVEQITKSFEKNRFMLGVFIDLSKAFDTVNHEILLSKLIHYGVKGRIHNWIKSYLKHRKQFVIFKNSGLIEVICGVPQGSILGPLLFLIYINDMYKASNSISSIMFADDTNLFLSHNNVKDMFNLMNLELEKFNDWFKANKLSLNADKTKFTLFHKSSQSENLPLKLPKLIMNDVLIERKDSLKFLGVLIDETLYLLGITKTT